jgi:hypothetical protein
MFLAGQQLTKASKSYNNFLIIVDFILKCLVQTPIENLNWQIWYFLIV